MNRRNFLKEFDESVDMSNGKESSIKLSAIQSIDISNKLGFIPYDSRKFATMSEKELKEFKENYKNEGKI